MMIWPSYASSLVWFRVISRTVPSAPSTSITSPMLKGWEDRITSPPATLPRMSSAASVTPKVSTDMMAVSDVVLTPRAPAVMMAVSTYSTAFTAVRVIFRSRSFSF